MLPDSLLYDFDTRCVWKVCIELCPDKMFFVYMASPVPLYFEYVLNAKVM